MIFYPYGNIARPYLESIDKNMLFPDNWFKNLSINERQSKWIDWRNETETIINKVLWPSWDYLKNEWISGDNQKMIELTKSDLVLLKEIHSLGILKNYPRTKVSSNSIPSHYEYFDDEDNSKLGINYSFYDTTLPRQLILTFAKDLVESLKSSIGSTSMQFKSLFQRPRAYQISRVFGTDFTFELAKTSMSPSMSSGHSLQGLLMCAGVYDKWLNNGYTPTKAQTEALAQFGIDIGDRRVFAGVHYPSDNIASWIIALRLTPHVFSNKETLDFVRLSIEQSLVLEMIKKSQKQIYSLALSELQS